MFAATTAQYIPVQSHTTNLDTVSVGGRHSDIDQGGALITCQDAGPYQGSFSADPSISL